MPKITKEQKIILIVGLIAIILGAIYRFSPFLTDIFSGGGEMASTGKKLMKYREILARRSSHEEELAGLTRVLRRGESGLLSGETPALAAVDIQNRLTRMAGKSDVEIKSQRVLKPYQSNDPSPGESFYMRVPVNVTLISSVRQLKEILYRIETDPKMLIITQMSVSVVSIKNPDDVRTTLAVEGLMNIQGN